MKWDFSTLLRRRVISSCNFFKCVWIGLLCVRVYLAWDGFSTHFSRNFISNFQKCQLNTGYLIQVVCVNIVSINVLNYYYF